MKNSYLIIIVSLCGVLLMGTSKGIASDAGTMSKYKNYSELQQNETQGIDYQIRVRDRASEIAILAPHGGGIEPGTTELARATAGQTYDFYSFVGLKPDGNTELHLPSIRFDEPTGVRIAKQAQTTLVLHGCSGSEQVVYLGGQDFRLREKLRHALETGGFTVDVHPEYQGTHPENICNQNQRNAGLQIELTTALRDAMFRQLDRDGRQHPTATFHSFVRIIRAQLSDL